MKFLVGTLLFFLQYLSGFSYELDDCTCGQANSNDHIVSGINGTIVPDNKYPWMVIIKTSNDDNNYAFCDGTIISDKAVLTAAHCIVGKEKYKDHFRIFVGADTPSNPTINQIFHVDKFIIHPLFNIDQDGHPLYDLVMIIPYNNIPLNPLISPICLPNAFDDEFLWDRKSITVGWGNIDDTFSKFEPRDTSRLIETDVYLRANEHCRYLFKAPVDEYDTTALMCTYERPAGPCIGSNGGPLFADHGYYILLGVASMAANCYSYNPSLFAKVTSPRTLHWIHAVIDKFGGNTCKNARNRY